MTDTPKVCGICGCGSLCGKTCRGGLDSRVCHATFHSPQPTVRGEQLGSSGYLHVIPEQPKPDPPQPKSFEDDLREIARETGNPKAVEFAEKLLAAKPDPLRDAHGAIDRLYALHRRICRFCQDELRLAAAEGEPDGK